MARPLRVDHPGVWYHVTSRGNARQRIFCDQRDRQHLCELLEELTIRFQLRLYAWVFMPNHYHLLLEAPRQNLSRAMQWLNLSYSAWFNARHRQVGHLFQGRFKSVLVDPHSWGYSLSRYLHLNPVRTSRHGLNKTVRQQQRAGVASAPTREQVSRRRQTLRSYPWSSYRPYAGLASIPDWLSPKPILERTGKRRPADQHRHYAEYVESALTDPAIDLPWTSVRGQLALGDEEFLENLSESTPQAAKALRTLPTFAMIKAAVEKVKGEKWSCFRDRRGDWGRDVALYFGRRHGAMKLADLAAQCGDIDIRTVSWAIQRLSKRLLTDTTLTETMKKLTTHLGKK